jgi:hypothetical protein
LIEEMLDAALPTSQMIEQNLPHDAPTQARPPAECLIHVGNADDILGDKIIDFPCQSRLQAIGHMSGYFFTQPNGLLPQSRVELGDALNGLFRRLRAANDLYQRNQVGD